MKQLFITLLLCCLALPIFSQEIKIKAVECNPLDLSAKTNQRKDLNGQQCALVKIKLPVRGAEFKGNIIGNVDFNAGEYIIYVSPGTKKLSLSHPNLTTTMLDFSPSFVNSFESGLTYYVTLTIPDTILNGKLKDFVTNFGSSTPFHLALYAEKDGAPVFLSVKDWKAMLETDKKDYTQKGLVIDCDGEKFVMELFDRTGDFEHGVNWHSATKAYGKNLPTDKQGLIIYKHTKEISDATNVFTKGELGNFNGFLYWTQSSNPKDNSKALTFCPGLIQMGMKPEEARLDDSTEKNEENAVRLVFPLPKAGEKAGVITQTTGQYEPKSKKEHLTFYCKKNNKIYFIHPDEWMRIPENEKPKYEVIGLLLKRYGLNFVVKLKLTESDVIWAEAMNKYKNSLPNLAQLEVINDHLNKINEILEKTGMPIIQTTGCWSNTTDEDGRPYAGCDNLGIVRTWPSIIKMNILEIDCNYDKNIPTFKLR